MGVVAGLALVVPASATAHVEVKDRATATMCSNTTAGHCAVHLSATDMHLEVHTFLGEVEYQCNWEVDFNVESDGTGVTTSVDIRDGSDPNCNEDVIPCDLPWALNLGHGAVSEIAAIDMCLNPPIIDTCEGPLTTNLIEVGTNYSIELTDDELLGDPNCEFTGDIQFEDPDGIEIVHVT